jgi:sugar-specific transcriptional regulator TrmB
MLQSFNFDDIGLETRDKRVYEALVANPQTSLRKLAELTDINRGSVYESVKNLVDAGLVGSIEVGKQRRYMASNPNAIIELLKERQQKAQAAEQLASSYIATLVKHTKPSETSPFATFYEDNEGVAAILRDVIATCSALRSRPYRVISTKRVRQYLYQNFPNFTQRRIDEKIKVSVIAVGNGGVRDDLSERKWLPATRGAGPNCYTIIYGDKTAFISMSETNVLSGIVVDNEGVANLQKELFERLWQIL